MTPKMEGSRPTLQALAELNAMLSTTTDADIRRVGSRLGAQAKGEKPLGAVHSIEAQRMWAAAAACEAMILECITKVKYKADSEEEMNALKAKGAYYADLESIARKIFWMEAKIDCGDIAFNADRIGLREGWMLVTVESEDGADALRKLLGMK